jgi:hypothetical protein
MEAVQHFGESVQAIHNVDPELAARLFPTYVDESLFRTAQGQVIETVKSGWAAEQAAAAAAANADEVVEAAATHVDDVVEAAAPVLDDAADAAAPVLDDAAEAVVPAAAAPVTTAPTLPNATADAVEATVVRPTTSGGSVIGENWVPGSTGDGKFTGTVSELLDRASAPRPTVAAAAPAPVPAVVTPAPAATVSEPLRLTVNARGEAVTGSGLIVPSYASSASGLAPADTSAEAIERLQDVMTRIRVGA